MTDADVALILGKVYNTILGEFVAPSYNQKDVENKASFLAFGADYLTFSIGDKTFKITIEQLGRTVSYFGD